MIDGVHGLHHDRNAGELRIRGEQLEQTDPAGATRDYREAIELYDEIDDSYQAGYCELMQGNLQQVQLYWTRTIQERNNHWCLTLFGLATRQLNCFPTLFQVRNHMESDLANMIQAGLPTGNMETYVEVLSEFPWEERIGNSLVVAGISMVTNVAFGATGAFVLKYGKYRVSEISPRHVNDWLLRDVLRGEWDFAGAVVSDYYAIRELAERPELYGHHIAQDGKEACTLAVRAGVNIELPEPDCYKHIVEPRLPRFREAEPAEEPDVVAENGIGERCLASPAISNGRLYVRGAEHLYCIGSRAQQGADAAQ